MKFGQRLLTELRRDGWEAHYLDYKALKKRIKKMWPAPIEPLC